MLLESEGAPAAVGAAAEPAAAGAGKPLGFEGPSPAATAPGALTLTFSGAPSLPTERLRWVRRLPLALRERCGSTAHLSLRSLPLI